MTEEQKEIARLRNEVEMLRGDFTVRMQIHRLNQHIIRLNGVIDELKTIISLNQLSKLPVKIEHVEKEDKKINGRSRNFTDEEIRAIRNDHRSTRVVGEAFNTTSTTVSNIKRRKIYAHVED